MRNFKMGFKIALGAYFGWEVARVINETIKNFVKELVDNGGIQNTINLQSNSKEDKEDKVIKGFYQE